MNARRLFLFNAIIFIVIIVAGFVGYYFYNQSTLYLTTDDAQITGQEITIASPVAGKLTNWNGTVGSTFKSGDTAGVVQTEVNGKPQDINITMPQNGTIAQNTAVTNEFVGPGTPLAYAFDMKNLWVTANIKETQISSVKPGQSVDVSVDAYPGRIQGTVDSIGLATANTFSLLPSQSTTADFTKVTQVIPVKITIQGYQGIGLTPGMSVTVKIHK